MGLDLILVMGLVGIIAEVNKDRQQDLRHLKEFLKALVTEFHNKIFAHQAFILMVHVRVNHYLQLKSSVPLQVFHE
uniref:Ring finger protein n=1 Tax=Solanum tuberosum TaxID=4113 RepID=M0ZN91_SOLTU